MTASKNRRVRCPWPGLERDPLMLQYHDQEWGVPLHDDRELFELLTLEGAQAGLSWRTILTRRDNYRLVFRDFEVDHVARFSAADVERLLSNTGIIRSRRKIESTIRNARAVQAVQKEFGSFDAYLWRFVGGRTPQHRFVTLDEIPAQTTESKALSHDLVRRGFNFVGPTTCYAFMEAAGLVNDHLVSCFRYNKLSG